MSRWASNLDDGPNVLSEEEESAQAYKEQLEFMRDLKVVVERMKWDCDFRGEEFNPNHWKRLLRYSVGRIVFPEATLGWNRWLFIVRDKQRIKNTYTKVYTRWQISTLISQFNLWRHVMETTRDFRIIMSGINARLWFMDFRRTVATWREWAKRKSRQAKVLRTSPWVRRKFLHLRRCCAERKKAKEILEESQAPDRRLSMMAVGDDKGDDKRQAAIDGYEEARRKSAIEVKREKATWESLWQERVLSMLKAMAFHNFYDGRPWMDKRFRDLDNLVVRRIRDKHLFYWYWRWYSRKQR